MGILELPVELKLFASQIQMEGFVDYQKTAGADCVGGYQLGSAYRYDFNRAKSENKWVEAALCRLGQQPAISALLLRWYRMEKTAYSAETKRSGWKKLQWLIDDDPARKAIAGRAYGRCTRECVTIFHATGICEWVERHWNLQAGFVLPAMEISGGIRSCTSSSGNAGKKQERRSAFYSGRGGGVVS